MSTLCTYGCAFDPQTELVIKRDDELWADAQICLTCTLPFCSGTDKCFRSRKRELNHERTTSEPRETVEEQSKTGTGGEQVEAVVKR